jgi:hypothetical protein
VTLGLPLDKQFVPPALPLPPEQYSATYHNELNKVLRLYFNLLNLHLDEVVNVLNFTGEFDTIYTNVIDANTVNANQINALKAAISHLTAGQITSGGFQGGNAVFDNMTAAQANASLFTGSGRELNYPHIAASDSTDQYADADDDPTIVKWDTADELRGFTLNNDYTATAEYSGVYKIDYSLQFANTANAVHDVYVWLQVNGSDVAKSASKFTLPARKSAGVPSFVVAYSSITFNVNAGDDIGLWWATDLAYNPVGPVDGVYMEYLPVQTTPFPHPSAPSAIGSIIYVSAPDPARTRVTPIGVLGTGGVGTVTFFIT